MAGVVLLFKAGNSKSRTYRHTLVYMYFLCNSTITYGITVPQKEIWWLLWVVISLFILITFRSFDNIIDCFSISGLFLFLIELSILCWVKFWDYSFAAAVAATVIVIPVLIIFVLFAAHFYHSLVVYKCQVSNQDMEKLEDLKRNLDQVTVDI